MQTDGIKFIFRIMKTLNYIEVNISELNVLCDRILQSRKAFRSSIKKHNPYLRAFSIQYQRYVHGIYGFTVTKSISKIVCSSSPIFVFPKYAFEYP